MHHHVSCRNCGAEIPVLPEQIFCTCEHCEAPLFLEMNEQRLVYRIRPQVKRKNTGSCISRWLKKKSINLTPVVREQKTVLYPFWMFSIDDAEFWIPAVETPDVDLSAHRVPQGERAFFNPESSGDDEGFTCMEPDVQVDEACERVAGGIHEDASPEPDANLVYIPFEAVRFTLKNRQYSGLVDSVSGQVWLVDPDPAASIMINDSSSEKTAGVLLLINLLLAAIFPDYAAVVIVILMLPVSRWFLKNTGSRVQGERKQET